MTLPTSEELQKVFHSTQQDSFEREQVGGISILGPSIHNLRGFSAVRDAILDALIVELEPQVAYVLMTNGHSTGIGKLLNQFRGQP